MKGRAEHLNKAGLRKDKPDQHDLTISEPETSIKNLRELQANPAPAEPGDAAHRLRMQQEGGWRCWETGKKWGITESQTGLDSKGP